MIQVIFQVDKHLRTFVAEKAGFPIAFVLAGLESDRLTKFQQHQGTDDEGIFQSTEYPVGTFGIILLAI